MSFSRLVSMAVILFIASACATKSQAQERSLYQRLGGYDAIAAVTDDFLARLTTEPQLTRFFTGLGVDSQKRLRQHLVNQLCEMSGGPCIYTGRSMKATHAGLGITGRDWEAGVKQLIATLDKFRVPDKEKQEVLAAVSSLKPEIVEK
jgi:hemoglobin